MAMDDGSNEERNNALSSVGNEAKSDFRAAMLAEIDAEIEADAAEEFATTGSAPAAPQTQQPEPVQPAAQPTPQAQVPSANIITAPDDTGQTLAFPSPGPTFESDLRTEVERAKDAGEDGFDWFITRVPFIGAVVEGVNIAEVWGAAKREENGDASDADLELLGKFLAQEERLANRAWWRKVVDFSTKLPAFAIEFAFTAGQATLGKEAARRTIGSSVRHKIRSQLVKGTRRNLSLKAVSLAEATTAGAARQAFVNPQRVFLNYQQRLMKQAKFTPDREGQLKVYIESDNDNFYQRLTRAFGATAVEFATEKVGDFLPNLPKIKRIEIVKLAMMNKWLQKDKGNTFEGFMKLFKKGGYNGIWKEMFEERVGEFANPVLVEKDQGVVAGVKNITTPFSLQGLDDLSVEFFSFLLPKAGAAGVAAAPGFAQEKLLDHLTNMSSRLEKLQREQAGQIRSDVRGPRESAEDFETRLAEQAAQATREAKAAVKLTPKEIDKEIETKEKELKQLKKNVKGGVGSRAVQIFQQIRLQAELLKLKNDKKIAGQPDEAPAPIGDVAEKRAAAEADGRPIQEQLAEAEAELQEFQEENVQEDESVEPTEEVKAEFSEKVDKVQVLQEMAAEEAQAAIPTQEEAPPESKLTDEPMTDEEIQQMEEDNPSIQEARDEEADRGNRKHEKTPRDNILVRDIIISALDTLVPKTVPKIIPIIGGKTIKITSAASLMSPEILTPQIKQRIKDIQTGEFDRSKEESFLSFIGMTLNELQGLNEEQVEDMSSQVAQFLSADPHLVQSVQYIMNAENIQRGNEVGIEFLDQKIKNTDAKKTAEIQEIHDKQEALQSEREHATDDRIKEIDKELQKLGQKSKKFTYLNTIRAGMDAEQTQNLSTYTQHVVDNMDSMSDPIKRTDKEIDDAAKATGLGEDFFKLGGTVDPNLPVLIRAFSMLYTGKVLRLMSLSARIEMGEEALRPEFLRVHQSFMELIPAWREMRSTMSSGFGQIGPRPGEMTREEQERQEREEAEFKAVKHATEVQESLSDAIDESRLPAMFLSMDQTKQVSEWHKLARKAKALTLTTYINGLLSTVTAGVSLSSGILEYGSTVLDLFVAGNVPGIREKNKGIRPTEFLHFLAGSAHALPEAIAVAMAAGVINNPVFLPSLTKIPQKAQDDVFGFDENIATHEDVNFQLKKGVPLDKNSVYARGIDTIGKTVVPGTMVAAGAVITVPTRVILTTDEFMKVMSYRGTLAAVAFRNAEHQGLTNEIRPDKIEERDKLMKQILALEKKRNGQSEGAGRRTNRKINLLHKQVKDLENPRTAQIEKWMQSPSTAMHQEALEQAAEITATRIPDGESGRAFSSWVRSFYSTQFVFAFDRAMINVARLSFRRLPLIASRAVQSVKEDLESNDPARVQMAKARMLVGTMYMGIFASLGLFGAVTGGGSNDPEERKHRREAKILDHAVRIPTTDDGDVWVSFEKMGGAGGLMKLGADYGELAKSYNEFGIEADELFMAILMPFAELGISPEFNTTMANFLGVLSGRRTLKDNRAVNNWVASAITQRQGEEARLRESRVLKEADGVLQTARAKIPGMGDGLLPVHDFFGRVRLSDEKFGPDFLSPFRMNTPKQSTALEMMRVNGVPLPEIPDSITGDEIKVEFKTFPKVRLEANERSWWSKFITIIKIENDEADNKRMTREEALLWLQAADEKNVSEEDYDPDNFSDSQNEYRQTPRGPDGRGFMIEKILRAYNKQMKVIFIQNFDHLQTAAVENILNMSRAKLLFPETREEVVDEFGEEFFEDNPELGEALPEQEPTRVKQAVKDATNKVGGFFQ